MKRLAILGAVVAAAIAVPATATQTIYTISGPFSAVSGLTAFTTNLTFTAIGNPASKTDYPFFSLVPLTSVTVASSSETATLDSGLAFGINPDLNIAFLVDVIDINTSQFDFPLIISDPFFATYAGLTSASAVPVTFGGSTTFGTSRGDLTLLAVGPLTFSATAVPEPAAWSLMIVGFTMTGFAARLRHRGEKALVA